jgi:hypothetical protein
MELNDARVLNWILAHQEKHVQASILEYLCHAFKRYMELFLN